MRPIGRPVLRVALGTPSLGLQLASRNGFRFGSPGYVQPLSIVLRFKPQLHNPTRRPYSSIPPSKEPEKVPESKAANQDPLDKPANIDPVKETPLSAQYLNHNGVKEKFSQLMDNFQSRVLTASHTLNDLTGYSDIEAIKAENNALERSLLEAHERLRAARQAYKTSNAKRAATQREVTTLLARKESWSPSDLERFTELYRTDHELEGSVSSAQENLTEAEAEEQSLSQKLNAGILKRYHEEQIWSDRIRRASTWGTWGLMGMNFLLFVVLQFVAEPWKRRRLVRGVVAEEKQVLEEVRGELAAVKAALEAREAEPIFETKDEVPSQDNTSIPIEQPITVPLVEDVTWKEFLLEPARWRMAAEDLYSERRLDLRMRDASALALEGAAAGAAVAVSIFWIMGRGS